MYRRVTITFIYLFIFSTGIYHTSVGQVHSVARKWNDVLLEAIRDDFARPTVHARNLFHTSVVMYDAWAAYKVSANTYLLGNSFGTYQCDFNGIEVPNDTKLAQEEAISYAAYALLNHRFENSPGAEESLQRFDDLMDELGYDKSFVSTDYSNGSAGALGNAIAECMIAYGLQDGSNEENDYANLFYAPVNEPLAPIVAGNPDLTDPNRWQPLALDVFIDQSGIIIGEFPDFLSPEWGSVQPFALSNDDLTKFNRDGNEYWVYKDVGVPPYIDLDGEGSTEELYKWNFALVSKWSSHLSPSDGVMWDISPASIGNIDEFPTSFEDYDQFYNEQDGGDIGQGHDVNPITNQPYAAQMVPRGDYGRVLAEFWADGPDSETPPGHWFTLLNYVNDHPLLEKKFKGEGRTLNDLEWDVISYLALGGAMHDAAITAWGIKGWYDYIRPISAIRFMANKGQSSDMSDLSYHEDGIPLTEGLVELVRDGDDLEGVNKRNVGKIKLFAWRGPDFIDDPETDEAGVGWILADNWWPYQRPSFVTPPFAGYVSGHSTYSRAAAEVLTLLTGDEYFPGGVGEFLAPKDEFLVFEEGPSVDVTLQWATYRDASDQCSLSRIWGGIHPPADDIPGRIIGREIGVEAFEHAESYFEGILTSIRNDKATEVVLSIFPNPIEEGQKILIKSNKPIVKMEAQIMDLQGKVLYRKNHQLIDNGLSVSIDGLNLKPGVYLVKIDSKLVSYSSKIVVY